MPAQWMSPSMDAYAIHGPDPRVAFHDFQKRPFESASMSYTSHFIVVDHWPNIKMLFA